MKVAVVVHTEQTRPEAEYTLATLLEAAGLPFEFRNHLTEVLPTSVALHYGVPDQPVTGGAIIPANDPALWRGGKPNHATFDGVPVLYTGQAPPGLFSLQGAEVRLGFDLVWATFWLLSRQEELGSVERDAFGRFPCRESWLMRQGLAEVPIVNRYAALLEQVLVTTAERQAMPVLRKARWPKGQSYAVILSHDVDDAGRFSPRQGMHLFKRALAQRSPRAMARGAYFLAAGVSRSLSRQTDPYWNFEAFMELEAEAGFRSTFFFVPEARSVNRDPPYDVDTPRMRDLLARLHNGGWEVGVHGSFDSYMDADILRGQREKLEELVRAPVHGIRQHYLRLVVPDTFRAQAEAGFAYDGTLGFRGGVGFRAGLAFPFRPFEPTTGQALPLLELPLTIMDGALFWQLKLTPETAMARSLAVLDTVREHKGLAVLLWHQRVRNEKEYPGWWSVYYQIVGHLREEGLAWVATAGQVTDWWIAREAVRLEEVKSDGKGRYWRYCAGQAVEGLTLVFGGAHAEQLTVRGTEATVREEEGETRLDLGPLAAGQVFEVVLARAGGIS